MTMRCVVDVLPQAIDEAREARNCYLSKSAAAEEGHTALRAPSLPYSVVAIAHAKRKPDYWRPRLSAPESASEAGRAK
jgi:hypothetical protein